MHENLTYLMHENRLCTKHTQRTMSNTTEDGIIIIIIRIRITTRSGLLLSNLWKI